MTAAQPGDRYVLLGLAPARADWFRAVAHWCNAASVPAEFVKCVSVEQVRAHLHSGRAFSAVVVDALASGFDRDLVDMAARAGVAVLAVGDTALERVVVLPRQFGPDHLIEALASCARRVSAAAAVPDDGDVRVGLPGASSSPSSNGHRQRERGRVIAVCGPGGTGASTVAIALAQGLSVTTTALLADLCLHADQAMLHDVQEVAPGVQELVEVFRARREDSVRRYAFRVEARGYDLLLGLRQPSAWPVLRPRAFQAAFAALPDAWPVVVCDTNADVEGERECGSADVEDRNVMARTALSSADVVVVVGMPGMKGVHSLVRLVNELVRFGVGANRIVPVVNRAPRSPRARAEVDIAVSVLLGTSTPLASPVLVPERRIDDVLRDGIRMPAAIVNPLASACSAMLQRVPPKSPTLSADPVLITPGSLGSWAEG